MDNANSPEYLKRVTEELISNLRHTGAPSVQMTDVPRQSLMNGMDSDAEDEADDQDADEHPDVRITERRMDQRIERDDEFDESDDEEMNEANGIRRQPGQIRQRNIGIMDYKNPHADPDIEIDEDGEAILIDPTEGANGDTILGDGSREENQRIANEKAAAALSQSPTPESSVPNSPGAQVGTTNGAPSQRSSAMVEDTEEADVEDMDVDDDEGLEDDDESRASDYSNDEAGPIIVAAAVPDRAGSSPPRTGAITPPESPIAVQPTADTINLSAEDVEMADDEPSTTAALKREEGLKEREAENQSAEKAAETAKEDGTA
jgi:histone deacetylase 1/2